MAKEELEDRSERREHPRYAVNIDVEVQIGNDKLEGLMVDISIEGLRISIPKLIKPSTDMVVTFSAEEEVHILSHAVWTLERSMAGLPSYLVGLKILSVRVNNHDVQGQAERTAFLDTLLQ
jgi:hypothetical protein